MKIPNAIKIAVGSIGIAIGAAAFVVQPSSNPVQLTTAQPSSNALQLPLEPVSAPYKSAGRLGAYIPVTSANTTLGYNPNFANFGGWKGFADEMTTRIREGQFTTALVWRPHGKRANGEMPLDAMLYLSPTSADPIERAAADERAFVAAMKRIKAALDANAGSQLSGNTGELWVYLGSLFGHGVGETPMNARTPDEFVERLCRVLHPLKVAGVDGVAVDATGSAKSDGAEAEACRIILAEGFALTGYEGWADKGKSEHWCQDARYTGFLMAHWSSEAHKLYPAKANVRGSLAYINCGKPGKREWATTEQERRDFVTTQTANGIDVYLDIWTATAKGHEITPAKGY